MQELTVHIWSDIACPWCYVGKRRFEAALAAFAHRDAVRIVWRAFELDPSAPRVRPSDASYAERLGKKYGRTVTQAQAMIDNMTQVAAADGLDFRFDKVQPGNTFDAHRVLHLALERGLQDAMKERLFRAYMTEGEAIGQPETLVRLASEVGLDPDEVSGLLATDTYAREVRADEEEARVNGITGVPFFVIGRYGVSGAQPSGDLLRVLERAWKETMGEREILSEGASCGVDGCD